MAADGTEFSSEVRVRRRIFASDDGAFAVLDCTYEKGRLSLVGPIAHLEENERANVTGVWKNDARFGPQVRVATALPLAPDGRIGVVEYLRRVRHIGAVRGDQLFARYGAETLEAIDRDPAEAFAGVGLTPKRAAEAAASWDALRTTRELHLMLAPHGLAYLVARIHKEYGDSAHRTVREDPYGLTSLFGVGFATADTIARGLGVGPDDPGRRRAAVLHALAEAEQSGSTCLPRAEVMTAAGRLLDGPPPETLIDELAGDGEVVVLDGEWVYRAETHELEAELAERVAELLAGTPPGKLRDVNLRIGADELTTEQWDGVSAAFNRRLSIVTGGPGTGKTASIKSIVAVAAEAKLAVLLAAPTGRAAVRMAEATGMDATTVHSALGWVPGSGPQRDDDFPLECDVLVIDETSMANLELLVTLLRAVGPETNVVLVGDADQLAPVGAGKPFADLVATAAVPTARLEHIFRQAAGSMIVQGAHRVRRGLPPSFEHGDAMRRDLFFIDAPDALRAREQIVDLVARRLPEHYGVDPVDDIQVFCPVYRGELGIDALNGAMRERLNPDGRKATGNLRIGDKLMMSGRNLHELGLMNGTLLRLDEMREDGTALVTAAGDVAFEVPDDEVGHLRPAYACSVHKGQGIELPIAILVAHPAAGAWFLRREMLYTAMTRATTATVIVGDRGVLERSVQQADTDRRYSRFPQRISAQRAAA